MHSLIDQYRLLQAKLRRWSESYYYAEVPEVSDQTYDRAYQELLVLEKSHPELITKDSPSQKVQGQPGNAFKVVEHKIPMLSINTETDSTEKGAQAFALRVRLRLEKDIPFTIEPQYCLEPKIDGLAISLIYIDRRLTTAATRGDGSKGEDVTHNVLSIESVPKTLPEGAPVYLEVRGEIYMPKSAFRSYNAAQLAKSLPTLMNTRNAAAGGLRQLASSGARRPLAFLAYQLADSVGEPAAPRTQYSRLMLLKSWGFPVSELVTLASKEEELFAYKEKVGALRASLDYDIDGVVYKLDALNLQEVLGYAGKEPRWAVAHKYPPEQVTTVLESIEIQIGRTGRLTPVASVTPVLVAGTVISKTTLHNLFEVRRKGVRVGDEVYIRRAGDVIPEIVGRANMHRSSYVPNFKIPPHCPACGGKVVRLKGEVDSYCIAGMGCPAQFKRALLHFTSRDAMDIKGLGESQIERLVHSGLLTCASDLYALASGDPADAAQAVGGSGIWSNVVKGIEASRVKEMWHVLYALAIPHVGRTASKAICRSCPDFEHLYRVDAAQLGNIKEVTAKIAKSLLEFWGEPKNIQSVQTLLKHLTVTNEAAEAKQSVLTGKTVVITGSFDSMTRSSMKQLVEERGGIVSESVSKKTHYLVAGANAGSKLSKATSLGVKVLTEQEFAGLL